LSARRPGHLATAEHMKVKMKNRLPGPAAGVDDRPVSAIFGESVVVSYARRNPEQVAKQRLVLLRRVIERFHVISGNHQHMRGRLRIDVTNNDATIVLKNYVCGGGSRDDFAE